MSQEREREARERLESMAYERASSAEVSVGLPYQLRPWSDPTPGPSPRHASTPFTGPAPHDVSVPSFEEQHASTRTNQPGFLDPTLGSSLGETWPSLEERWLSSEERHTSQSINQPELLDPTLGLTFEERHTDPSLWSPLERHAFAPIKEPAPRDAPGSSFEERHAFTPIGEPAPYDPPELSTLEQHRFTGIYGNELYESPEQLSAEQLSENQNTSTQSMSSHQQESQEFLDFMLSFRENVYSTSTSRLGFLDPSLREQLSENQSTSTHHQQEFQESHDRMFSL